MVKRAFEVIPPECQSELVHCKLFDVFLQHHKLSDAISVMTRLMRQKMPVPVYMCNNLIIYYVQNSMQNRIPIVLQIMEKKNIPYSLHTYNVLLSYCSKNGDIERMERMWDLLQADAFVKPDFVSYATLASAYLFTGQHDKALSATLKAENDLTEKRTTVVRLKKLIASYGSLKQGGDVGRVYEKLKNMPGVTSIPSYVCVIEAYGEAGLLDSAEEVMQEMKLTRGLHHLIQYNAILGVYCKIGKMMKAEEVLNELLDKHKPDMLTYSYLLLGCLKHKQSKKALVWLKNILTLAGDEKFSSHVFTSRPWVSNISIIFGLLAERRAEKHAKVLVTALQKAKLDAFPRSYNFVMQAYERSFGCSSVGLGEK